MYNPSSAGWIVSPGDAFFPMRPSKRHPALYVAYCIELESFLFISPFYPFVIRFIYILVVSLLLSYSVDVRSIDLIPSCHVLLHAGSHAGLFAAGERAAGLGDAFLEAVFLEFL